MYASCCRPDSPAWDLLRRSDPLRVLFDERQEPRRGHARMVPPDTASGRTSVWTGTAWRQAGVPNERRDTDHDWDALGHSKDGFS